MDELESKIDYMNREIQVVGHRRRVGTCDAEIQLMLYRKVILPTVPTLTYDIETASNLRNTDFIRLGKMQGKCLLHAQIGFNIFKTVILQNRI